MSKQLKMLREKTVVPQGGRNSPVPATAAASAYPGPLTASLPCRVQMSQHHSQVSQHLQINQLISLPLCVCIYMYLSICMYLFMFCFPGGSYLTQAHPGDREGLVPDVALKPLSQ